MYISRLHTHHLSPVGLFCYCKWKPNIHKLLYMGYCLCDNYTFVHIHFCICTLSGTALPQELVDSNIEQERSDLNHGCVVCATNMQVQWTRSWWKVFSFGCTIWVEEPAKLVYFCVDLWSIQHTYRWGDKSTISIPIKYSRRRWNSCHKLGYQDWPNEDVLRFWRLLSGDNL